MALAKAQDRRFMELAVKAMKSSRAEHTDKRDPLVGAVLVDKAGKVLGEASRAGIRVGNHAEYTLLERFLAAQDLEGATLYVTLEPCLVRSPPKKGCARHIAAARIGRVVVGIADPNPEVNGKGLGFLAANGVEIGQFDGDLRQVIRRENREFLEQFSTAIKKDQPATTIYTGPSPEEGVVVRAATAADFSATAVREYAKRLVIAPRRTRAFLLQRGFLRAARKSGVVRPTLAGLVCFGTRPDVFLPQCKLALMKLVGTSSEGVAPERVAPDGEGDVRGPLLVVIEEAIAFFRKHVAVSQVVRGARREEVPEYPERAVREAIVNALVHRDYKAGRHPRVLMYRDRIVVESPGYPPAPLTLREIRDGTASSIRRNPLIAEMASDLRLMEQRGEGFRLIRAAMREHGLADPVFDYRNGFFVVELLGRELSGGVHPTLLADLTERQQELLRLIVEDGRVTSGEYARRFGITRETANQDFVRLMSLGLIERRGRGRATFYVPRPA